MAVTTTAMLRRRYGSDAVATASPARLVVMLYDRLLKDLHAASTALAARDIEGSHHALLHAQEIVAELSSALDLTQWPEGESLAALYQFLGDQLIHANVHKDADAVASCVEIVEPLRDAWSQASVGPVAV
jgi:flagellar protein FliS